jgi:hypothetical protein
MQLVAYGAQDVYLTASPQITFFRSIYRRHTNYSHEPIEQTFSGSADFGRRVNATISRNGDMISKMYLQVTLPDLTARNDSGGSISATVGWQPYIGLRLISSVEIELGGQRLDKHFGEWMMVWNELSEKPGRKDGYNEMVGADITSSQEIAAGGSVTVTGRTLWVPLQFYFCNHPGLSLPIIALQYHELKCNLELSAFSACTYTSDANIKFDAASIPSASLQVDFIYLDSEERRRTAQLKHEYLVTQLQFTGEETLAIGSNRFTLQFNHPCKELIWTCQATGAASWNDYSTGDGLTNPVVSARILLNGHERISERAGTYFNLVQPYQYHTNVPALAGINSFSFALDPESCTQPSGSCNMSRIDNATLMINSAVAGTARIYATNWNILRILSGMGGLAYAN